MHSSTTLRTFPTTRLRRMRQNPWSRDLMAETNLTVHDLIYPLFVRENDCPTEIKTLPGVVRHNETELLKTCEDVVRYGIPAIAIFPYIENVLKDEQGSIAHDKNNLMCRMIALVKKNFGHTLGIIADVALDPYTTHGHDGVIKNGCIDNEKSTDALIAQALVQAHAGADVIAPSDMMDGRIGRIRHALDTGGFEHVCLLSYAAKYASAFYGPFREAVGAGQSRENMPKDKKTYQMDYRNTDEALHEIAMDIGEGADMIMVKPAMPYLDVLYRAKTTFQVPTYAFQVSGEFAMLKHGALHGGMEYADCLMEALTGFKRAGADGILTYGALDAAKKLCGE